MNNIKNYLLALCIGCVAALAFDAAAPACRYFYQYETGRYRTTVPRTEATKEVYMAMIHKYPFYTYTKQRQINTTAIAIGAMVTVIALLINPLKKKNA